MQKSSEKKAKIVCTLGPSSRSVERICELIESGMDVARLNFSHGDHAYHLELIQNVRKAAEIKKLPIAIMQDLQGPKLRVGKLPGGRIELTRGQKVLLHPEGSSAASSPFAKSADLHLPIQAEIAIPISKDIQEGARILFDDGKIASRVLKVASPEILVEIEVGGPLKDHKGMNLPGTPLTLGCLTDKDLEDLKFGLEQGVDAIALSFVRAASDIEELQKLIRKKYPKDPPLIVAKMEREEAVEAMDSIIEVADVLLVARGDMAVELGAERVPTVQKKMIHACNRAGVPIITATQMLESMINSPTPTRAEASDVANAVFDGTDAVMLSAETASGEYPVEAVRTMARIILESERSQDLHTGPKDNLPTAGSVVESIEFSASRIASHVGAVAIAPLTHSGMAARALAKYRPETPIVAILDNAGMQRKLSFVWGVKSVLIPQLVGTDDLFAMVEKVLIEAHRAQPEDLVVVTAGVPTLRRGTTNMVKVHRVGAAAIRGRER